MKLSVLVDNNTIIDQYYKGEPGLSFHIKDGGKNILFDVGYSNIFIENAIQMKLNLNMIDYLILSHGHLDHTGGLDSLIKYYFETKKKEDKKFSKLIAHPDCFKGKYYKDNTSIGINISEEVINNIFEVKKAKKHIWITEKLLYLGAIKRENNFEAKKPIGYQKEVKKGNEDYIIDDTALAYTSKDGLVIITGCSHSGICNIVEQAKRITKIENVIDIIGGLHLLNPKKETLMKTKDYIKNLNLNELHACHCTDLNSKVKLAEVSNLKEIGAGMKLIYE